MFFNKPQLDQVAPKEVPGPNDMDGFEEFMRVIRTMCGVDLEPKREITLQRIKAFAKNKNIATFKDVVSMIRYNSELRQDILNLITVNETYFYRELPQLRDVVSYAKDLSEVRILCAPCSSGDEVYSIAMLAQEIGVNPSSISIVGIDINSEAIAQCNSALYNERSLHRLDNYQKERFFVKKDDKYEVKKHMLCRCDFRVMNIFDDSIFNLGKFDIILSRNMMIYFNDEFRLKCIERLHRLLGDYGRLYTGHADLVPHTHIYEKRFSQGASYYEKV